MLNIVFPTKSGLFFLVGGRDNIFGTFISEAHERKINRIANSLYDTSKNKIPEFHHTSELILKFCFKLDTNS